MAIRVLHVVDAMNRGGAETMLMNLFREIDKSKVQFDFLVHTEKKGAYEEEIEALGGKVYRISKFKGINFISYIKQLKNILKETEGNNIIHGHIGSSAAIYLSMAKRHGYFTIAHSHNTAPKNIHLKNILFQIMSYPTRYIADYFFACGIDAGKDRFGSKIIKSKKFQVLNNAIESGKFIFDENIRRKKRKEIGVSNKFIIGHIGRFEEQKNHEFIIDIFNEIYKENNEAVLLLVGKGSLYKKIYEKVVQLQLENVVIFTGLREDISELLQAMDVFVFPSYFEGLPVTVIEAQASGLKCVLSDTITKEVDITQNIEYISLNKKPKEWAKAILEYRNNYNRENMSNIINEKGYDIKTTSKWLEEFYLKNNKHKKGN